MSNDKTSLDVIASQPAIAPACLGFFFRGRVRQVGSSSLRGRLTELSKILMVRESSRGRPVESTVGIVVPAATLFRWPRRLLGRGFKAPRHIPKLAGEIRFRRAVRPSAASTIKPFVIASPLFWLHFSCKQG
jgi:hypothetical protein